MKTINRVLSWLVSILLLVMMFYFLSKGQVTEAGFAIVGGGVVLGFLNIDRLQEISAAGFEAEIREATSEAYATITQLKKLATVMATVTTENMTFANRFGGLDVAQKHRLKDQIDEVVSELGLQSASWKEADEHFYYMHSWDHLGHIHDLLRRQLPWNDKEKQESLTESIRIPVGEKLLSPDEVIARIKALDLEITPEVQRAIDDYAYYLAHREPRLLPGRTTVD